MTLTATLTNLLHQAKDVPDTIVEIRLKRGLVLGIKYNRTYTTLRIKRDAGSPPNEAEWRTVINSWPYHVGQVQGPRLQDNGHALVGRWPSPDLAPTQIPLDDQIGASD